MNMYERHEHSQSSFTVVILVILILERVTIGRSQECLSRGLKPTLTSSTSSVCSLHFNKNKHIWIPNLTDTEDFLQRALTYKKDVLEGEH